MPEEKFDVQKVLAVVKAKAKEIEARKGKDAQIAVLVDWLADVQLDQEKRLVRLESATTDLLRAYACTAGGQ